MELHEALQEMHAVATVPDLYPIVVQLNAVPSMLELLSHENTDISVGVVSLLQVSTTFKITLLILQIIVKYYKLFNLNFSCFYIGNRSHILKSKNKIAR